LQKNNVLKLENSYRESIVVVFEINEAID